VDVTDKLCMHHLALSTFLQTCPFNEAMTVLLQEYMLLKRGGGALDVLRVSRSDQAMLTAAMDSVRVQLASYLVPV